MEFIRLPVKFYTINDENEKLIELGLTENENNVEDGFIFVNSLAINAFNEDSEGFVTLLMSDGINHKIYMKFDDFYKMVTKL